MPARPLAATRRTALVVTAGLTGLTACTTEPPADPADPASTSAPPVDADQVLVDGVVERLNTALGVVVTAGDASRPLARELAGLNRMHVAHLEALGGSENWTADIGHAPERREVLATEARLQRFLTTSAVKAESGTLAKLFASMSAAVAQHLVALG